MQLKNDETKKIAIPAGCDLEIQEAQIKVFCGMYHP
jgi:hypothetical protein